jgi:glycosyltransferase involved in cell wall biosynthesis
MIDVLIPAHNSEKTIRASVDSILQQTVTDIRVIVVDDGSSDRTSEILREMAGNDLRLQIIRTENRGIVSALNTGLAHCRADLVARHDADDLAFQNRFARQAAYLQDNPDCIAVSGNAWHIDASGRRIGITRFGGDARSNSEAVPAGEPYLMHPFLMIRRAVLEAVGGYRHVFHAEDTDLYWRIEPLGRLHILEDVLGEYRIHSGSLTSKSVLNARIGAVNAQLAALSARRRLACRHDVEFSREMLPAYEQAASLSGIVAVACRQLERDEQQYLELATAAKMVELRVYRAFRFTLADISFILGTLLRYHRRLSLRQKLRLAETPLHYLKIRTWPSRFLNLFAALRRRVKITLLTKRIH